MTATAYRVLARKYRPANFAELIGQDALVRTLRNAIAQGRVAQAFILTGVRGVGKTTTARLIARALNCVGATGQASGPTPEPCGVCDNCRAIADDRHPDVIEMDAASRTGVDNIRELIDGVRYLPVQARYKVYILDEVHMLSEKAFNALLKTLEEPPAHVKFIFCTTELRKVPVTVLSRCQRFDLRRVDVETLSAHLAAVAAREAVAIAPDALSLLARAAEGSVRDGLSLLDQAIAHGLGESGGGTIAADQVRAMLGLADRALVFDLFDKVMRGQIAAALTDLRAQYDAGADPVAVLQDLLALCHWLTRVKVEPASADDVAMAEAERARGRDLAQRLEMPVLARAWQMLLKGLEETRLAPTPLAAAEMALVRLAYAADLPAPADLLRELQAGRTIAASPAPSSPSAAPQRTPQAMPQAMSQPVSQAMPQAMSISVAQPAPQAIARSDLPAEIPASSLLPNFAALVDLFAEKREGLLKAELFNHAHLVRFEQGLIELRLDPATPRDVAGRVAARLEEWTGRKWVVALSNQPGAATLAEQARLLTADRMGRAREHPLVQAALKTFPGAELVAVRETPAVPSESPTDGFELSADEEI